jgi:mono/diheme cytochrome c family protein
MDQLLFMKNTKQSLFFKVVLPLFLVFAISFFLLEKKDKASKRWYTKEQVMLGKEVFANNCAVCHGFKAEKTIEWKKTLSDGSYPPPPLNGTAHAWHHPYKQMIEIITDGGASYKGNMPAFKDSLTLEEKDAAIAYFQSFWSDDIYNKWIKYDGLKGKK